MPLDGLNYQGKNFAPLAPLRNAKKMRNTSDNPSSISAFIREIEEELNHYRDDIARKDVIETGRNIALLDAGKLIMKRDSGGSGYVFLKPLPQTTLRDRSNFPVFAGVCETLKAKWLKAQPQMQCRNFGDGYKAEIQANAVNTVVKSYFKSIFTPHNELQEALEAQRYGTYIWQFFYDDKLNRLEQIAPIVQQQPKVLMPGYQACYECGFEGAPEDFQKTKAEYPQCPECDSYRATKGIDPKIVNENVVVDYQTIGQGDITGRLRPFPACLYDPRVLPHDSSFFAYDEYVPLRLLRQLFGEDLELAAEEADDLGLQVIEALAAHGGSIEGYGASSLNTMPGMLTERAVFKSRWLKPEWYADFKLSEPEKTLSGTIPANVPFGELFPEGICYTGFPERGILTGLHAEPANVRGSVFFLQSHSGVGKGLNDSVDVAKDLNELHSMAMAALKRFGAPGVYYDKDAASQEEIRNLFKPFKAVPLDLSKNGIDDIRKAVGQLQTQPFNPAIGAYAIQLNNLLHMSSMTGDFSEGTTQQVDINTLGGQQLAHAKEEEKKGGVNAMKVDHRMGSAEIIIGLFRKHIRIPVFFSASQDRHGATKGKWISGAMMPDRMQFDAVPDSEIPTNTFEKRIAAKEMVREAGGILAITQAAMLDPKGVAWYAEQCGVTVPMLDREELQLVCLARLDEVKRFAEIYSSPEEILGSLSKSLSEEESGHEMKADFISEILDDDEIDTWNPLAKATMRALIQRHRELAIAAQLRQAQMKQRAAMALQAEGAQMQAQANQPLIDQQNQEQTQQMGMQAIGGLLQNEADQTGKEMDHEREIEKGQIDDARQQRNDAVAHERARSDAADSHGRQKELEQIKAAAAQKRAAKSGKGR